MVFSGIVASMIQHVWSTVTQPRNGSAMAEEILPAGEFGYLVYCIKIFELAERKAEGEGNSSLV